MNTLCGTELRTSSPRIQNYADSDGETGTGGIFRLSHATPWPIRTAQVITNRNCMTAVMYQVTELTCSFIYGMGLKPAGINQLMKPITS